MQELINLYEQMGISQKVYEYGEAALKKLADRFAQVDKIAEYNQAKVLSAMQKNRVSAACFAAFSIFHCHLHALGSSSALSSPSSLV